MKTEIKNIVLADDDQDDVEMFQTAIEESCTKLELTVASDGLALILLLEKIPTPDAIFLDLNMPGKSGKMCLEEIRSNDNFKKVPIIILSTSNHKSEIDFCLNNGANRYFVKPNSYKGLISIIEIMCKGEITFTAN